MFTIEARISSNGSLSQNAAAAALVLWRSRQFSTADIAELLSVREADVARVVAAPALPQAVRA